MTSAIQFAVKTTNHVNWNEIFTIGLVEAWLTPCTQFLCTSMYRFLAQDAGLVPLFMFEFRLTFQFGTQMMHISFAYCPTEHVPHTVASQSCTTYFDINNFVLCFTQKPFASTRAKTKCDDRNGETCERKSSMILTSTSRDWMCRLWPGYWWISAFQSHISDHITNIKLRGIGNAEPNQYIAHMLSVSLQYDDIFY